jgi:hypothetical protein
MRLAIFRGLYFIALVSAALLALEKYVTKLYLQGADTGFYSEVPVDSPNLQLKHNYEKGQMMGWIWLKIHEMDTSKDDFVVELKAVPGEKPHILHAFEDGWLKIWQPPEKDQESPYFKWVSGYLLVVSRPGYTLKRTDLEDWEVHTKDLKPDSKNLASHRRWFDGICLTLAAFGVLAVAIESLPKVQAWLIPDVEIKGLIGAWIKRIKGATPQEGKQLRAYLRAVALEKNKNWRGVLKGLGIERAADQLGLRVKAQNLLQRAVGSVP